MSPPRVSALIALHDGAETIGRAIRSVLAQTHTEVEAVVVDDASSDNSCAIVEDLVAKDPRVKLIRRSQGSGGPATPRNEAIKASSGEFLALLDQDDEWLPTKVELQLEQFEDRRVGLVFSNCRLSNGALRHDEEWELPDVETLAGIARDNPIVACSAIWPRAVTDSIGGFNAQLSSIDDRDYWVRIAIAGFSFRYVPAVLAVKNTLGERLSSDRVLHDRLSVEMWTHYADAYPGETEFSNALAAATRRHALSVAHSNRTLSRLRRPYRVFEGWRIDPTIETMQSIARASVSHQRLMRLNTFIREGVVRSNSGRAR